MILFMLAASTRGLPFNMLTLAIAGSGASWPGRFCVVAIDGPNEGKRNDGFQGSLQRRPAENGRHHP